MNTRLGFAVAGLLSMALAGCGGTSAGSCTVSGSPPYCVEYRGSAYVGSASAVQAACAATTGGTYSAGACATGSGRKCVFGKGTASEFAWVFPTLDAGNGLTTDSYCTTAGGTLE